MRARPKTTRPRPRPVCIVNFIQLHAKVKQIGMLYYLLHIRLRISSLPSLQYYSYTYFRLFTLSQKKTNCYPLPTTPEKCHRTTL